MKATAYSAASQHKRLVLCFDGTAQTYARQEPDPEGYSPFSYD
jgi:uncharacterized protein (DUF2235 family)